jgi:CDP-diacylglycerol--glycerol-3-phosphate 3-phosphatidyltransferase
MLRLPVDSVAEPVSVWNIANVLTMLRVGLVPLFAWLLFGEGGHDPRWRFGACMVFGLAMVSDLLDGAIARRYSLVTDFGKVVDPVADKVLVGTALIGLSVLDELPWWVTTIILGRELGITVLRVWVIRHGIIAATPGGKVKTLLQGLALSLYVLVLTGWPATLRAWIMAAAVAMTVVTGMDYVNRALRLRQVSGVGSRSV